MPCLKYSHLSLLAPALLVLLFPDYLNNPPLSFDGISLEVFIALSHSPFNLLSYKPYKIEFPISSPLPAVLLQLCVFVAAQFEVDPVWCDSSDIPQPTLVKQCQAMQVPWRVCKRPHGVQGTCQHFPRSGDLCWEAQGGASSVCVVWSVFR